MKTIHSSQTDVSDSLRAMPRKQVLLSKLTELSRLYVNYSLPFSTCLHDCNRVFGPTTLLLFTKSDFLSVVLPWTIVGLMSALSGPLLTINASPSTLFILARTPAVFVWMWLNALVFSISNQRLPASVLEDQSNKPWRPVASGRISPDEARKLLLVLVPVVFLLTSWLGAGDKTLYAMVLTYMYNDLQGSDESFLARNGLNALGLTCWAIGATQVATGGSGEISSAGYRWLVLLGVLIFTTIQMPDFRDLDGDKLKGRKTMPIVLGEEKARWVTGALVVMWSVVSPLIWGLGPRGLAAPVVIGGLMASLLVFGKSNKSDEKVWKMWGLWVLCVATLPLWKYKSM